ncbi:MAG: low molecular weight phosphotyrosine protein phosphatase [Candidatus Ancillula sp.]|jgi:protein-tyrosine phosphatase|nr:low molecular weight phosphotyrosine protein phosphatase [Candidatus Ancillula sp.]
MSNTKSGRTVKIMAVCTGNICRSAMAEVVLLDEADKLVAEKLSTSFEIASSGVSSEEQGNCMDYRAQDTLRRHGYTSSLISTHRASRITSSEIKAFDLFLPMTSSHANSLVRLKVPKNKIYMWRWFESFGDNPLLADDLADPWYGDIGDFEVVLRQIKQSAENILRWADEHVKT